MKTMKLHYQTWTQSAFNMTMTCRLSAFCLRLGVWKSRTLKQKKKGICWQSNGEDSGMSIAEGLGSTPGQGTRMPQGVQPKKQERRKEKTSSCLYHTKTSCDELTLLRGDRRCFYQNDQKLKWIQMITNISIEDFMAFDLFITIYFLSPLS